ncbi:MAG: hypothetical protein L3J65_03400 [Robiginitomaculum sp.]|nr:hypothetical protein [Robiginitomaculum sp.]
MASKTTLTAKNLVALDAADLDRGAWTLTEWENAKMQTLDTLGQIEDAQTLRWSSFEKQT